jgi:AcrR family transcriptional regulator
MPDTADAPSVPAEERPLRADARRNRERVIKAARAVFGERGRDAQVDDVARCAKVGVGTVYRHFPTKEALLEALVRDRFAQLAAWALEALEEEDAWEAFERVVWRGAELHAGDRALAEATADAKACIADQAAQESGLAASLAELMARAQRDGTMRPDARPEDLPTVFCGLGSVMHRDAGDPLAWRRYLALMLDGLRAVPARAALPS